MSDFKPGDRVRVDGLVPQERGSIGTVVRTDAAGQVFVQFGDKGTRGYFSSSLVGLDEAANERPGQSTIGADAHEAVYGDREDDYGHPRESFTRIAGFWSVYLSDKLAEGAFLSPEDVARMMVLFKVSRDVNSPKRDNRVDGAGYFIALDRLETGQ